MPKKNKNILAYLNIVISIIFLAILSFSVISDNVIYLILMTLFIGWAIPYFVLIITGISMFNNHHPKLGLVFNICNFIITIILLLICLNVYDKYLLVLIIEYSCMNIISLINNIYYRFYLKNHPNPEIIKIKKIKKENNGAIV